MRLLHYLCLGLVLAGGMAGSLLLIPRESELSLMYFRGRQFADARPLYERRLARGDRSPDVVIPLAELYVQAGEVGRAVDLLRQVRGPAGGSLELFERVAAFQKYGQETDDFLQTLEAINRLQASEGRLRELAGQYRYRGQTARLIPALEALTARYRGEPAEHLELANLLAVSGRVAPAAAVLTRFEARFPREVTADTVEFLVSALLDAGQPAAALERAEGWVARHSDPARVARLAMLLRSKGQGPLAERLIAPFQETLDQEPELLAEWLQQQLAAGRVDPAFERLARLHSLNRLPEDLVEPLIDLALARKDVDLAIGLAEQRGVGALHGALLGMLVERALAEGRETFAYRAEAAGGGRLLQARPLLAARIAYARGDRKEAARRLDLAEADVRLKDSDRLAAAGLDEKLGRRAEALVQLGRLGLESAPEEVLLEAARLYVAFGKGGEAAARFAALRARRRGVDQAWALADAAAGSGAEVARWLQSTPERSIGEPLLRDLYFLAQEAKQATLALAAAGRLFREYPGDANRLNLARALNESGQPLEALPHLRALLARGRAAEEIYTAALLGAVRQSAAGAAESLKAELRSFWMGKLDRSGQDERQQLDLIYGLLELGAWQAALPRLEELARRRAELVPLYIEMAMKSGRARDAVAFLEADLARGDLPRPVREARVYALLEHGGSAEALPHIRRLAAEDPRWITAYEETLSKHGLTGELLEFWKTRLAGGGLSPEERRGIGYKLIDAGQRDWARQVFLDLARGAAADHPDVAETLFLWGPKPGREVLDWLEGRARAATGAEQAPWLRFLLDAGAPERVAGIVAAAPPAAGRGGPITEVYLRALVELRRVDSLSAVAVREAAAASDRESVRKLARIVKDAGGSAAEPVYARLLALDSGDPEARHWLGIFAYSRARYSSAEDHFSRLLAVSAGGFDDNFYYAEILWRKGKRSQARAYYGRAMRLIEAMAPAPPEARAAYAQSLFRCGDEERAFREYRRLVSSAPRSGEWRADFGAVLLEAGMYDEADEVLSGIVTSGGTRMAQLRAQLLSATAHRSEALALVRDLADAHPGEAGVLASLGVAEQGAGRMRRAQSLLNRAFDLDAGNEDLRESRAAIERERAGAFHSSLEFRNIEGAQSDRLIRVFGERLLSSALRLRFGLEQDHATLRAVRFTEGRTAPFAGVRRRGEAALEWETEGGIRAQGLLFAGNSTVGGGVVLNRPDARGSSAIRLEVNRADWDFAESLAQEGVRDRIEVRRETIVSPRVSMRVAVAANRYSLPGVGSAASSVGINGDVTVLLLRRPNLALGYAFDAEYRLSARTIDTPAGAFQPLPLVSGEVHAPMLRLEKQITRGLRLEGAAGMAVDRLGGSAPFFTAGVGYEAGRHFALKLDYDRRLYTLDSTRIVTSFRAAVSWRF